MERFSPNRSARDRRRRRRRRARDQLGSANWGDPMRNRRKKEASLKREREGDLETKRGGEEEVGVAFAVLLFIARCF